MTGSLGDFAVASIFDFKFTTVDGTGAPTTLSGSPALSVYKDNSATQSTTGITLSADFDGVTGLNNVRIDTSADGTFYSAGSCFDVVITTGTVDGVSVVGYRVGGFTLEKTSALRPTVAGRTLDVTAGGAAGVDWGNVENPTTTVGLSGTTLGLIDGAITAAKIAADAITAAKIQDAALTAAKFASGAFDAVWSVATRTLTSVADSSGVTTLLGKLSGITSLAEWLGLIAGKQAGNATARTELRATGAGSGTYDETADSQEAIRDRGDAAWTTATGFSTLDAAGVRTAVGLASANLDTQLGAIPTNAELGTEIDSVQADIAALNNLSAAQVNAEVDTALADIHLDHLLATTYDPAAKPGAADALLNELVESDAGVSRFTANALEQAPTGGSAPTASEIADAVWEEALADHEGTVGSTAEALADAGGAGASAADIADAVLDEALSGHVTPGSLGKAVADVLEDTGTTLQGELDGIQADTEDIQGRLPAALVSGRMASDAVAISGSTVAADAVETNIGNLDAAVSTRATPAQVNTEADTALADVGLTSTVTGRIDAAVSTRASQTSVDDVPTNAELAAALAAADDAVLAAIAALNNISQAQVLAQVEAALTATVADSVPADGTRPSISSGIYMLVQFLLERQVSGTTVSVKKPDGSTQLFALTLNDATTPTTISRSA